jgi:hypothetical protein
MPEIDAELFQWATLGLLVLVVILLLLLYSALGQLRRALEQSSAREQAEAPLEHTAATGWAGGAQPASAQTHPLETARYEAPAARSTPVEMAAEPLPAAVQPAQAQVAAQPEPQEQPFEQDGRWWFRRGDELLVYDERAGQWVPAPAQTAAAPVAQTPAAAVGTGAAAAPAGEAGSFWKCPSCGAINGSTATSCRMCFTARP